MNETAAEELQAAVRELPQRLEGYREMLLANLVMIGEIPAPTFKEQARIEFVKQRFVECGLEQVSSDTAGNGLGILRGRTGRHAILLHAHADTPFPETLPHTLNVEPERVVGPGVADNALGLAAIVTLPTILDNLGISLDNDLVFMASVRSLGRGNLEGLRAFLVTTQLPLLAGLSIEGVPLGRMDYVSQATVGAEITCRVDPEHPVEAGAIPALNQVITQLRAMELPAESQTRLVLGSIAGGTSYKAPALSATLRFQLRGDADPVVDGITEQIVAICDAVARSTGVRVEFDVIARTRAGGLPDDHPLVVRTRHILEGLGIDPLPPTHSSAASVFLEQHIPSITLGVSYGAHRGEPSEYVEIAPMLKGLAQLIGVLQAIDGGCCD